MTMFITEFCKICELNTELFLFWFLLILKVIYTGIISGSRMGLQLLQNTELFFNEADVL